MHSSLKLFQNQEFCPVFQEPPRKQSGGQGSAEGQPLLSGAVGPQVWTWLHGLSAGEGRSAVEMLT